MEGGVGGGGGDAVVLSSARPLVAPSGRIQRTPSQESAGPPSTPEACRKQEYQHEEIVSEAFVGVKTSAPQIHVIAPPELTTPVMASAARNDSNPHPPAPRKHLGHIVQQMFENGTYIAHFAALAISATFFANACPDLVSTTWLLVAISLASIALFRHLKL